MIENCVQLRGFPAGTTEGEIMIFVGQFGPILHLLCNDSSTVRVEFARTVDAQTLVHSAQKKPIMFSDSLLTVELIADEQQSEIIHYHGNQKTISKDEINQVILGNVKVLSYLLVNGEGDFDLYIKFPDRAATVAFIENFDKSELDHVFGDPDLGYTLLGDLFDVVGDDLKMGVDVTDWYLDEGEEGLVQPPDDGNGEEADAQEKANAKVDLDAVLKSTINVMDTAKSNKDTIHYFKSNQGSGLILYGKRGLGRRVKQRLDNSSVSKVIRRAEGMLPDQLKSVLKIAGNQQDPTLVVLLEIEKASVATQDALVEHVAVMSNEHACVWVVGTTTCISELSDNLATSFTSVYLTELLD